MNYPDEILMTYIWTSKVEAIINSLQEIKLEISWKVFIVQT